MKNDEVIQKVEAEAVKAEMAVIRWSKAAWAWVETLPYKFMASSLKTKAVAVIAVLIALMVLFDGVPSQSTVTAMVPDYMTRSEASVRLSTFKTDLQSSIDSLSRRMDKTDARVAELDSLIKMQETKPEPSKITTGSISKKAPIRRRVRKSASESSFFDLP